MQWLAQSDPEWWTVAARGLASRGLAGEKMEEPEEEEEEGGGGSEEEEEGERFVEAKGLAGEGELGVMLDCGV